jgi:hypothetical protein
MIVCAMPLWLWWAPLSNYRLKLDDFAYVARSRTVSALEKNLFVPHNGHVVPLFLVETHLLCRVAGSLANLPVTMACASYLTLVIAAAAVGHVVAWETGRASHGLAALAGVALSTVLGPALLWYAAGQALICGTVIVAMLAFLQAYRAFGRGWLLAMGLLAAAAAPLFWTAGYLAGGVGLAYLYADGRRACRRASVLPLLVSVVVGLSAWMSTTRLEPATGAMTVSGRGSVSEIGWSRRVWPATAHTAQAICEAILMNNLGLNVVTREVQAVVLVGLLGCVWVYSRWRGQGIAWGGRLRVHSLEAAGAGIVVLTFGMIFAVRGTDTTFENLRALGWYDAIPQLGAVLFVGGWASGGNAKGLSRSILAPSRRALLWVLLLVAILVILQTPRAQRVAFEYDGLAAELDAASRPRQRHVLTPDELVQEAGRQRRALSALDGVGIKFQRREIGRSEVERLIETIEVPGMPMGLEGLSVSDLLDLRRSDKSEP